MKSRITIDVDHDNQPIIKIEYSQSEDVRDKLVKRFLESFGSQSTFANFFYTGIGDPNTEAKIRPIGSAESKIISEAFYNQEVPKEKNE